MEPGKCESSSLSAKVVAAKVSMVIEGTAAADLMRIVTASTYPWRRCISSAAVRPPDKNSFRIFKEEYRKDECAQFGPSSIFHHRCTIVVINAPEAFGGISL